MVLDVSDIVDMQLGSGKGPPRETSACTQRLRSFSSDHCRRFGATVFQVLLDSCFVVERGGLPVRKFLVIAKERLVFAMKWLLAEGFVILSEIIIRIKQGVKRDLTKGVVP